MKEKKLLELLRTSEINILRALFVSLDERWTFKSMGAPYSRLYFVTEGGGFLKTEDQFVNMTAGNLYFIPSNVKFSCGCKHLEKLFFHVSIPTLENYDLFESLGQIYSIPYPVSKVADMKKLMQKEDYLSVIELRFEITRVLIRLCRECSFDLISVKKHSALVSSVIDYIKGNVHVGLTVSDISREFFVSESKIRNAFKEEMGIPIGKYMDDMVFMKAMLLLSKKDITVAAASAELGFCDQFYLSRRFKERIGMTPSHFKKINAF